MAEPVQEAAFWDKVARKYAASVIGDMAGYERTLARVRQLLTPADVVVEFGCGTGTSALRLAPAVQHILATDYSRAMIEIAREKAAAEGGVNVTFAVEAPELTVQADASFDAALAFNLLHLVKERPAALAQIYRVVRPGGLFISKTPCLSEMNPLIRLVIAVVVPVARWLGKAPYVESFNAAQLEAEIVSGGFEIVERGRHGSGKTDFRLFLVARRV